MRVEKMLPFLYRYPDREPVKLLGEGFSLVFRIVCSLSYVLPMAQKHCSISLTVLGASGKTEGPTSSLSFLNIVLDLQAIECRLPADKLKALKSSKQAQGGLLVHKVSYNQDSVSL